MNKNLNTRKYIRKVVFAICIDLKYVNWNIFNYMKLSKKYTLDPRRFAKKEHLPKYLPPTYAVIPAAFSASFTINKIFSDPKICLILQAKFSDNPLAIKDSSNTFASNSFSPLVRIPINLRFHSNFCKLDTTIEYTI